MTSSITNFHPEYTSSRIDWDQARDTYLGERKIKSESFKYLPATSGMLADGARANVKSTGFQAYSAYKVRARFPGLVRRAVEGLLGVMHNKPATFELPEVMQDLVERVTLNNESLQMLLQKINEEQLVAGRVGLMLDIQDEGVRAGQFYISMYQAERIINWDDGRSDGVEQASLNLVVLDETEDERGNDTSDIFTWEEVQKHRALVLGDPRENEPEGVGVYRFVVVRENEEFSEGALIDPRFGSNTLAEIPFVFINTKDVIPKPDLPPLLDLSNHTLTIYRGEADYRQSLFLTGQDTLVVIGGLEDRKKRRVGAGAEISLPIGADAKYIGVSGSGLPEQRMALENDYQQAQGNTGELAEKNSREAESGDALKIRVSSRTSTLNQIAITGAFGLEQLLKKAGRWMGLGDAVIDTIKVIPNMEFVDETMGAMELTQLVNAMILGAPMSLETIHSQMTRRGMTDKTFQEELETINSEREQGLTMPPESTNEDGQEEDEEEEVPARQEEPVEA